MISIRIPADKDGKNLVSVLTALLPELGAPRLFQALRHRDIRVNGQRIRSDQEVASGDVVDLYLPDDELADAQVRLAREGTLLAKPAKDPAAKAAKDPTAKAAAVPKGKARGRLVGATGRRIAGNGSPSGSRKPGPQADDGSQLIYRVVHEDEQLIIVEKPAGISVHGDRGQDETGTLIARLKDDYRSDNLKLCHRLDRNTGGLLMIARDTRTEEAVREAMEEHLIVKRYRCLVRGVPTAGVQVTTSDKSIFLEIKAYLEKDSAKSDVYIHDYRQRNDHPITTRYRVLRVFTHATADGEAISELEVELVSGRTHQIRAHFAHIGHPLLGDGKYGRNSFNRQFRGPNGLIVRQQLYAVSLLFSHKLKGILTGYAGRIFTVPPVYDLNPSTLGQQG